MIFFISWAKITTFGVFKHLYMNFNQNPLNNNFRNVRAYIKKRHDKQKLIVDTILNGSDNGLAKRYSTIHNVLLWVVSAILLFNISLVLLVSVKSNKNISTLLHFTEYFVLIMYVVELFFRLFSASVVYPNCSKLKARFKYSISLMGLIDYFAIIPIIFSVIYFINYDTVEENIGNNMRIIFAVALLFKLVRYFKTFRFIISVFQSVAKELFFGALMALIVVVFSGTIMYYIESQAQPEVFYSVGQGMWWSVITYATVGYGDIYPITPVGKILASVISLVGIGMIALPAGIISSAFIKKMNEVKANNPNSSALPIITSLNSSTSIIDRKDAPPTIQFCPFCGKRSSFDSNRRFCTFCGSEVINKD